MLELIKAGGLVMVPILLLAVLALAIIIERFWSLRSRIGTITRPPALISSSTPHLSLD